jgi:plasmid stabilization system protein ParE
VPYPIRLRPQVEREIVEAMAWYESRSEGLGVAFWWACAQTLFLVADNPEMYRAVHSDVRRAILRRFPYALFYRFDGSDVVLLACLHENRSPELWPERG